MRRPPHPEDPLDEAPPEPVREKQEADLRAAWHAPTGWSYFSRVNNTDVGIWYTAGALFFFLFGGVLALLMRVQLAAPDQDVVGAVLYDQLFTMHGSIMMFLFAVPVFEGFAVFILPSLVGSRELPFPRLSAYAFWCYLFGSTFFCLALPLGMAPEGGWFMYPPLTSSFSPGHGPDIWLLGLSFIEISSIAAAVELIVGVLKCRAPGMRINFIPLYGWYVLVVGAMILFAFPPLIAGDLLLELERTMDWPFFDPRRGGDPLLWQHLFWIFGHPEVYIVFLPSIALVAMIVPTFARTPIVGYSWIVLAAVGTGFLSFGLWVHHMFTTGLPGISLGLFSAASEAVAIPTGVQIFCFIATLWAGKVRFELPVLYVLGGFSTFIIGGLTGVMVALVPFDGQAHDSYFIVAHLHSVLIGGVVIPMVGGLYYYFPLVSGKHLSKRLGTLAFWLVFIGFNVTFLPMHLTGMFGMQRRVYTYDVGLGFGELNILSTVGAFVLAAGFLVVFIDVVRPKGHQPYAERNPWGAGTIEWAVPLPDDAWGLRCVPEIDGRYPLWEQPDFARDIDEARFFLADSPLRLRESIVTSPIDAHPEACIRVPGPSWWPLLAALFTGVVFIAATFYLWTAAAVSAVLGLGAVLYWLWTGTNLVPEAETRDVGLGLELPLYVSGPKSVGWWAMLITLLGDATAFVSLLFGYFFYWTAKTDFPLPSGPHPDLAWGCVAAVAAVLAWLGMFTAERANRSDHPALWAGLLANVALAVGCGVALVRSVQDAGMDPTAHAYPATVAVLVLWCAVHLAVGTLMSVWCIVRKAAGRLSAKLDKDLQNVLLWWHFLTPTIGITLAVILGFPEVL